MFVKLLGAAMVLLGCAGIGFRIAAAHRKEICTLKQLIGILDYMECELQYRLTPLPQLCRQAAQQTDGGVKRVFSALADELESQISPDAQCCMESALHRAGEIPPVSMGLLKNLGQSLGLFDLNGQLSSLEAVRTGCRSELAALQENKDTRLRSYQTLGVCAGAALAILLI